MNRIIIQMNAANKAIKSDTRHIWTWRFDACQHVRFAKNNTLRTIYFQLIQLTNFRRTKRPDNTDASLKSVELICADDRRLFADEPSTVYGGYNAQTTTND